MFLPLPLVRLLSLVVVLQNGGDFTDDVMNAVADTFANLPDGAARYPTWFSVGNPDNNWYITLLDTAAMRNILPPAANGISGTIDSFRFSSFGINVWFNAPDLINQGVIVAHRYPNNVSTKQFQLQSSEYGLPYYAMMSALRTGTVWSVSLGALQSTPILPVFTGGSGLLPSPPTVSTHSYHIAGTSFGVTAGDSVQYNLVGNVVTLVNISNPASVTVLVLGTTDGVTVNNNVRFYVPEVSDDIPERVISEDFTVIGLPPLSQQAIIQANPKSVITLAKEFDGVYLPLAIFEPVFKVTHASLYRKVLLMNSTTSLTNDLDYNTGWFDTCDVNFGVSVLSFRGIPWAAKPQIKVCRGVELVPSADSLIGVFTTGCPRIEPAAIDVAKSMSDEFPQAFPSAFNGLGTLWTMACNVIDALPRLSRSGRNIATAVADAMNSPECQRLIAPVIKGLRRARR